MTLQAIKKRLLDLAIRGSLVPQIESEGTADDILQAIAKEQKTKTSFSEIPESEQPFSIPSSWRWVRLGEIVNYFSTGPFGTMLHKEDYCKDGIPVVNPTNIKDNKISDIKIERVSIETANRLKSYKLSKGDFVLARRGDLSKIAIVSNDEDGWVCGTGSFFLNLRYVINEFFVCLYNTSFIQDYLLKHSSGSTMANLNQKTLFGLPIPLPPLSEQTRIVTKLETMLTEIDGLEQSQKEIDGLKTAIWRRCLSEAISGRLTTQQPSDGSADDLLEQIKAAHREAFATTQKKYKPLTFSPIPDSEIPFEIPENWRWVRLGEIAEVINGKNQKEVVDKNGEYPIYGSGGIIGRANSYLCPENCTIIGRKGTINNPIYVETKFWNVDTAFGMSPFKPINPKYYFYFCKSFNFAKLDTSTAVPSLTKNNIQRIPFPLPPLSEQLRIVTKLEKLRSALDKRG